jgi:AcrR family transcriptional regulator
MTSAQAARAGSPRGRDGRLGRLPADERLLEAVTRVVARDGYSQLTVETVRAAAGVSRATFYQYFSCVDDCFRSAYREHGEQLVSEIADAVTRTHQPELAALGAIADTAIRRPEAARLLMIEGLAGGPAGLRERDALMSRIAELMAPTTPAQPVIDLPAVALIGGAFRYLSICLTAGDVPQRLRDDVDLWARAFRRRQRSRSWSARFTPALLSEPLRSTNVRRTTRRPQGAPRERILRGTAQAVGAKGYRATTVSDIVAAAGMSRRLFYNHFPSKAETFAATYEFGVEQTIAACAPAFFRASAWPERVWESALAFTGFVAREPLLCRLGFVDCYALGPRFAKRVHDTQLAFTLFLEDGYRQRPEASLLPRACSSLTAAAIMELGFQASRRGAISDIRRLQPLAVYVALTPFIGRDAAGAFVSGKLAAGNGGIPRTTA